MREQSEKSYDMYYPSAKNNECKASKLNKLTPQAAISCTCFFPPSVYYNNNFNQKSILNSSSSSLHNMYHQLIQSITQLTYLHTILLLYVPFFFETKFSFSS